ncbi:MAG: hypothetical protein AAF364_10370 [Pseudomonadota bacterium]
MSRQTQTTLLTSIIALGSAVIGFYISSVQYEKTYKLQSKSLLAEKKLEIYVDYMSSVNQAWAQFKSSGSLNNQLRQKGIDSFEALTILAPPAVVDKANSLNAYFTNLHPGYEITDDTHAAYNKAFREMKLAAQSEFIVQ